MKYLKRFNEELKSQTYRSAARKLNKIVKEKPVLAKAIGAEKRAKDLEEYGKSIAKREEIQKWKENIDTFSKYGEFNFELSFVERSMRVSKVYPFYLDLTSDMEMLIDSWEDEDPDNRTISFGFSGGLIPKSIDDLNQIEMNYSSDFYNGFFWGFWLYVDYKVENSEVSYNGIRIYDYDDIPIQIADRKTAVSLKKLLVNFFDETFEYPSGYTNIPNMYDKINQSVIQDLEVSATYGIDMGRIKEDIKNTPITSFYKQ